MGRTCAGAKVGTQDIDLRTGNDPDSEDHGSYLQAKIQMRLARHFGMDNLERILFLLAITQAATPSVCENFDILITAGRERIH